MNLTEIRDTLTRIIDIGYGSDILRDDNDPHFAVCGIKEVNGRVVFECDEVTNGIAGQIKRSQ